MKRIKAACIMQTLVFSQKMVDGMTAQAALELSREEVEKYRTRLKRDGVRHRITDVQEQPDGSIVLRVRRQLNGVADVDEYFA